MSQTALGGPSGIALIDKPSGWTSHDVVARCRRLYGTRRVGHAGTLDPMATGLLVLGVNRASKLLTYLVGLDKTYSATVRLGQSTVTDDAEGEVTGRATVPALMAVTPESIRSVTAGEFTGRIQQVPSAVSAIKVDGVRSYARVRSGQDVALQARGITVAEFIVDGVTQVVEAGELVAIDVDVTVTCSSGTYIRALARDLGARLDVGGHLTRLRRDRVGPFSLSEAAPLPPKAVAQGKLAHTRGKATQRGLEPDAPPLLSMAEAASRVFEVRALSQQEAVAVRQGKRLSLSAQSGLVAGVTGQDELVAILENRGEPSSGHYAKSVLVIPEEQP